MSLLLPRENEMNTLDIPRYCKKVPSTFSLPPLIPARCDHQKLLIVIGVQQWK